MPRYVFDANYKLDYSYHLCGQLLLHIKDDIFEVWLGGKWSATVFCFPETAHTHNRYFHRLVGPAKYFSSGFREYFINDKLLSKKDWEQAVKGIKK